MKSTNKYRSIRIENDRGEYVGSWELMSDGCWIFFPSNYFYFRPAEKEMKEILEILNKERDKNEA